MSNDTGLTTLNVSLEDHLATSLRPLLGLLPESLAAELKDVLDFPHAMRSTTCHGPEASEYATVRTIPYTLLAAISKWARTRGAEHAMSCHEPPLRVQDYSMVALLAGTGTSPERKFPFASTSTLDFEASHRRELGDRRAVTAVINALLSIGGSGVATWWAAGRLSWRDEWKVLLALSVAIIVAASEAILYIIWEDRRSSPHRRPVGLHGATHASSRISAPGHNARNVGSLEETSRGETGIVEPVAMTSAISVHIQGTPKYPLYERTVASRDAK